MFVNVRSMRDLIIPSCILILTACNPDTETVVSDAAKESVNQQSSAAATPAALQTGEAENQFANDDLGYLTQLGLMRGHLFVGHQLYKAGHFDHAKMHMKHPESELYAGVAPAFNARGVPGFSVELSNLSQAVENESPLAEVDAAYTALTAAIAATEAPVVNANQGPAARLALVVELLRVAGEEYAIAVVDGQMQNAHEYQDALGFTKIARNVIEGLDGVDTQLNDTKKDAIGVLDSLAELWPSLIPPDTLNTEAGALYGAAAKIEIIALAF